MSVIEVEINGLTLVLPLEGQDTVASITERAVNECRSFHLRHIKPKRVLYAKDGKGRVLSGALKLPLVVGSGNNSSSTQSSRIEIVMEEHSEKDQLPPIDVERQYRHWQYWVITQLKTHIEELVYRERTLSPSPQVITLLKELYTSIPEEDLQLQILQILKLLLSKCEEKQIVIEAAEMISHLFVKTIYAEVAIQCLQAFHQLNPLQLKLFHSIKYIQAMIDVYYHLTRFNENDQSRLFQAFVNILTLVDDEELTKVFYQQQAQRQKKNKNGNSRPSRSRGGENSPERGGEERDGENSMALVIPGQSRGEGGNGENEEEETIAPPQWIQRIQDNPDMVDDLENGIPIYPKHSTANSVSAVSSSVGSTNITTKQWNIGRLQSLLLSDDVKIRSYGLEKVKKQLLLIYEQIEKDKEVLQQQKKGNSRGSTRGRRTSAPTANSNTASKLQSKAQSTSNSTSNSAVSSARRPGSEKSQSKPSTSQPPLSLSIDPETEAPHLNDPTTERLVAEGTPVPRKKSNASSSNLFEDAFPLQPPQSIESDEDRVPVNDSQKQSNQASVLVRAFVRDEKELQVLIQALFQCLKNSIKARPSGDKGQSSNRRERPGAGDPVRESLDRGSTSNAQPGIPLLPNAPSTDSNNGGNNSNLPSSLAGVQSVKASMAGKLIHTALQSPETDRNAVSLCMDCLYLLYQLPVSVDLPATGDVTKQTNNSSTNQNSSNKTDSTTSPNQAGSYGVRKNIIKNRKINPLTVDRLTVIQQVFMITARDWYRLLFTLSHCDEVLAASSGSNAVVPSSSTAAGSTSFNATLPTLAEHSALFFVQTIVHGMKQGWSACTLQLELSTLARFLFVQHPNYRLYMGLTYLVYITKQSIANIGTVGLDDDDDDNLMNEDINMLRSRVLASFYNQTQSQAQLQGQQQQGGSGNKPTKSDLANNLFIEILSHNKFMLLKSLWWWSIGERSNFLIRRLSLQCIAQATVMSDFALFLWKLEPMPK